MVLSLAFSLLAGCDTQQIIEKFAPPEDVAAAKDYVRLLRERKFDELEKLISPEVKNKAGIRQAMADMADQFPPGEPKSIKLVGAHFNAKFNVDNKSGSESVVRQDISMEYEFPDRWLLVQIVTDKTDAGKSIYGFRVNPIADSLENTSRFSLKGKSALHYAMFAAAIAVPLFILAVLFVCVITPVPKLKWLWIIAMLFGVGQVDFNWSTGEWQFQLLNVLLFGAGVREAPYGPWIISIAFPAGAVAFLVWRALRKPEAAEEDESQSQA
jgi:hypothetical protein